MALIARAGWLASLFLLGVEVVGCGRVDNGTPLSGGDGGNAASAGARNDTAAAGGVEEPNVLSTGELGACNAEGWCWQYPTPAGDFFTAISDDGRYAVGENGIVFQWPDRYLPTPDSSILFSVQSAGDTVWAGGYGLWRYDGTQWHAESSAQVGALSVSPSGEVWAVLDRAVQHRQQGQWVIEQPAAIVDRRLQLLDLMVVDDDTVWALATPNFSPLDMPDGGALSLFEFTAGAWSERASALMDPSDAWRFLRAGSKVYVEGGNQRVYSPADDWALVGSAPVVSVDGLFSSATGELLVSEQDGLYTLTDQGSQKVSNTRCSALVSTSGDSALCAQPSGGLSQIRLDTLAVDEPARQLDAALYGSVPTSIWAQAPAAWGTGPNDVWRAPLDHFDGVKWTSHSDQWPENSPVLAIDGSATDNVWFRGYQHLARYDGQAFHSVALPDEGTFMPAVHTVAPNDTWLISGQPANMSIWHFDGANWENTFTDDDPSIAYASAAFAGGGSRPLWLAIGQGLYRRDGDTWQKVVASDGNSLLDIAVDGSDVWLLAQAGVYQLVDGALAQRGIASSVLDRIALTDTYVWYFSGTHARTLLRQK